MTTLPDAPTLINIAIDHYLAHMRQPEHAPIARGRCTVHFARRGSLRPRTEERIQRAAVVNLRDADGALVCALYVTCASGALVWNVARPRPTSTPATPATTRRPPVAS